MNSTLKGKDGEIAKAIAEWMQVQGFSKSFETFLSEADIKQEEIPKTKILEKKWTTMLILQNKINDLEKKIKTMKDEYEQASNSGISYSTKNLSSTSMVYFLLRVFQKFLRKRLLWHIGLQLAV